MTTWDYLDTLAQDTRDYTSTVDAFVTDNYSDSDDSDSEIAALSGIRS